jgi:hypothetical protein
MFPASVPLPAMKKMNWASILLLLFFVLSCTQNEVLTREEVIAVINRFDQGWKEKNVTLVDSVLAPVYIYFTQSGGTFSRDNILQTAASPEYRLQKMERQEFIVQLQGNTAIVSSVWKGTGVYRGQPFNDTQRCSLTITNHNGSVQILSEHCTLIK